MVQVQFNWSLSPSVELLILLATSFCLKPNAFGLKKQIKVRLRLMNLGEATVFSQLTKSVAKVCAQINGVCVCWWREKSESSGGLH
jgi:hypothetical protein